MPPVGTTANEKETLPVPDNVYRLPPRSVPVARRPYELGKAGCRRIHRRSSRAPECPAQIALD
jgi:hypothetical protein